MAEQIPVDRFKKEVLDFYNETFEQVQGIYLDKGTSFFDTLESVSAEQASRSLSPDRPTIAAQVEHVRFYLRFILEACFEKKGMGKVDWATTWQLKEVSTEEWDSLKKALRETHREVLNAIEKQEVWEGEDDIGASLAMLVHTAYHLGALRRTLHEIG